MAKFRSKIVEIHARQLESSPSSLADIIEWAESHGAKVQGAFNGEESHCLQVLTPEGTMTANVGDWVIRGTENEFYPCRDSVFQRKYEAVE